MALVCSSLNTLGSAGCGESSVGAEGDSAASSTSTSSTDPAVSSSLADDTNASTGSAFITDPDLGDGSECDYLAQDCAAGFKCMPWANDGGGAWNAAKCVPIVEYPAEVDEPCQVVGAGNSGVDDCDIGLICWDVVPQTGMGRCAPLCLGSWIEHHCIDPGRVCWVSADATIAVCIVFCDTLDPDCAPGESCQISYRAEWECAPDGSGDMGALGDPCDDVDECDPGLVCASAEAVPHDETCVDAAGCCTEVCDLTDPAGDLQCTAAADGATCQPYGGEPPFGLEHVGMCVLPP